jgi:hypothetical protein
VQVAPFVQPGERVFDDSPMPPQPVLRLNAAPRDERSHIADATRGLTLPLVASIVGMRVGRPGSRASRAGASNCRDRIQEIRDAPIS